MNYLLPLRPATKGPANGCEDRPGAGPEMESAGLFLRTTMKKQDAARAGGFMMSRKILIATGFAAGLAVGILGGSFPNAQATPTIDGKIDLTYDGGGNLTGAVGYDIGYAIEVDVEDKKTNPETKA